jgi:SWI/SNF-related matrix-associated actin-dependent regulator of chromatin subfamily A member 5
MPELFNDPELFDKIFDEPTANGEKPTKEQICENKKKLIKQIHAILRPFMLRRVKDDCLDVNIPPKKEIYLYVNFTPLQREVYKSIILHKKAHPDDRNTLQNPLMHLRKAAIHPFLFPGIEKDTESEFGEHLVESSGKMKMLDKLLKKLSTDGHRCLIFSQFKMVLDILEDYCQLRAWKYGRLDGDCTLEARDEQVTDFVQKDGNGEFCSEKF